MNEPHVCPLTPEVWEVIIIYIYIYIYICVSAWFALVDACPYARATLGATLRNPRVAASCEHGMQALHGARTARMSDCVWTRLAHVQMLVSVLMQQDEQVPTCSLTHMQIRYVCTVCIHILWRQGKGGALSISVWWILLIARSTQKEPQDALSRRVYYVLTLCIYIYIYTHVLYIYT